jgi:DNA-3-methyladenine glycosylase
LKTDHRKLEIALLNSISGKKLSKNFFLRDCLVVAKELIGKILIRRKGSKIYAGMIVETEAYKGSLDAAAHSYRGKTKRNEVMFDKGGKCYVYFTYGNHYCMNAVTGEKDLAHAVLIRALEPLAGIEHMMKNRKKTDLRILTNGPGKLTQALEIDSKLNGVNFGDDELGIYEPRIKIQLTILKSRRIGITKNADKPWRFYAGSNPYVSGAGNLRSRA